MSDVASLVPAKLRKKLEADIVAYLSDKDVPVDLEDSIFQEAYRVALDSIIKQLDVVTQKLAKAAEYRPHSHEGETVKPDKVFPTYCSLRTNSKSIDHGSVQGLEDDDHPALLPLNGLRSMTGPNPLSVVDTGTNYYKPNIIFADGDLALSRKANDVYITNAAGTSLQSSIQYNLYAQNAVRVYGAGVLRFLEFGGVEVAQMDSTDDFFAISRAGDITLLTGKNLNLGTLGYFRLGAIPTSVGLPAASADYLHKLIILEDDVGPPYNQDTGWVCVWTGAVPPTYNWIQVF